ncbi:hypothetical protein [Bacillus velezensis]|nr:hypothetical protein [Bacillus velezensis]UUY39544.1 hypothetical protein NSY19_05915 [Bacillus velezensis]
MNIRSTLYLIVRILGDVNADKRGKIGQRIVRREAGKAIGRLFK